MEQGTALALIEVKEHLEKVQEYLHRLERESLRNAKPSLKTQHARNHVSHAVGLIDSILAKGR